jgi:hypothetical protein
MFHPINFIIENITFSGKRGLEALEKFNKRIITRNDGLFLLNKRFPIKTNDNLVSICENVCNGKIYKELERYCPNASFLLNITYEKNGTSFYTILASYRYENQNDENQNNENQNDENQNNENQNDENQNKFNKMFISLEVYKIAKNACVL